jgi:hypothetical protein
MPTRAHVQVHLLSPHASLGPYLHACQLVQVAAGASGGMNI